MGSFRYGWVHKPISVTWRTPNLRNIFRNSIGETCSKRETASRTKKKDTKQYSQSKARQLLRQRQKKNWTLPQSFLLWLEKQVTHFLGTLRSRWLKVTEWYDYQKNEQRYGLRFLCDKTKQFGLTWRSRGSSWKELKLSPTKSPSFEKNIWEAVFEGGWKVPIWECLYVFKKARVTLSTWTKNGWEERKHGTQWKICRKNRHRRSNASDRWSVFGMHAKGYQKLILGQLSPKPTCSKRQRRQRRLTKEIRQNNIFVVKDNFLELWHEKSCRRVHWEILWIGKEKWIFSRASCYTLCRRSLDTTQRLCLGSDRPDGQAVHSRAK